MKIDPGTALNREAELAGMSLAEAHRKGVIDACEWFESILKDEDASVDFALWKLKRIRARYEAVPEPVEVTLIPPPDFELMAAVKLAEKKL